MKSSVALALAFALGAASLSGRADANPDERRAASGDAMSGMMNGLALI